MMKWVKQAGVVSLVAMLGACATSPTGRNQLLLFPEEQMSAMGQQAFTSMKEELKVSHKRVENSYVECVARSITAHVPQDVFAGQWEVVVFDDEQVNAFALPGGKIGVYTGLLDVAKNQHQLAAVIGHEVGHVIAHHGNERMSIGTASQLTTQVVGQILAANEVPYTGPIMAAMGLGAQVGVQLPYSRSHESEADLIGLTLMAQSGFNPQESVALWHNMDAASEGNRPPELLSTHPAPDTRIQNLQANMVEANALYQQAPRRPDCK